MNTNTSLQKLIKYSAMMFVFVSVALVSQLFFSSTAFAATRTWDDGGSDNLFSTAANWSSDTVPVNGDTIVIDVDALSTVTANNDLTGLSLAGISFTGSGSNLRRISGNAMTIQGTITNSTPSPGQGIENSLTLAGNTTMNGIGLLGGSLSTLDTQGYSLTFNNTMTSCLAFSKSVLGSGAINFAADEVNLGGRNTSYTGAITVSQGKLLVFSQTGLGTTAGSTTVSGTGSILLEKGGINRTFDEPFVFGGSGTLEVYNYSSSTIGSSGGTCSYSNPSSSLVSNHYLSPALLTLTGGVTLQSNFSYSGFNYVAINGAYTSNSHSFTTLGGSRGRLITNNDTSQIPIITTTISDSQPTVDANAGYKDILILNGDRRYVRVGNEGRLMGTGNASLLLQVYHGTVDPGTAIGTMGTLHFSDTLAFSISSDAPESTYHVDIKDATNYDKLAGGASFSAPLMASDAIILENVRLEAAFVDGWAINQGDQFMIIENQNTPDADDDGSFNGLAEGAQLTIEGITFTITYTGGDGNDVVLTALNSGSDPDPTPTPPNTGVLGIVMAHPALPVVLGLITAILVGAAVMRRRARE